MKVDPEMVWPSLDQARAALENGDGRGVKVAVVDSGIETSHPMLQTLRLEDDEVVSLVSFEPGHGQDVYGHGTAVTSVLLDEAPGVTVGSFRALDTNNLSSSAIVEAAVKRAIILGYQVINCSFGCRGRSKNVLDYKKWIDQAYLEGIQVVAASSNQQAGISEWPSHFSTVIGVRGVDCDPHEFYHQPGEMISFRAKGEKVKVAWKGGLSKTETGSSFAAARISGKIARILSVFPNLDPSLMHPLLAKLAQPVPRNK